MEVLEENYLVHYGILKKSGRYPWGSGANPLQRSKTFLDILEEHKRNGLSDAEIAKLYDDKERGYPFTTSDLRAIKSRSVTLQKQDQIRTAQSLKNKGMGDSEIGRQMGLNESTVRSLLEPGRLEKLDILQQTSNMLKRQVDEKGMVDIGSHVERDLPIGDNPEVRIGISKDKFNTAVSMLKEEGYSVVTLKTPQVGTGEMTTRRVLAKPGMTQKDVFLNRDNIQLISEKSVDGGRTYQDVAFQKPLSISAKRVGVRYKEDGGADADGVIYVRPGVKDISLGKSQYAQVRIAVGDTHFLKGMAVYKDDLPTGVDLLFNTNKSNTGNKLDALKPLKTDKEGNVDWKNPFGAFPKLIGGQVLDEHGKVSSSMNILNEQGDWDKWSRTLSRQVLSKQSPDLAKSQLNLTYERRKNEFDQIKSLTNPLIKKKLLESFADETDSAAVHLKAAELPRQATKVILPVQSLKPHEIFAPTFNDGERVILVRFPHAGTFELPELTVNNRNREGKRLFSKGKKLEVPDAVGIHPHVAERLSGADFDGDHVVVIPNNRKLIEHRPALEGLKDFDPQSYKVPLGPPTTKHPDGEPTINDARKQNEMGKVTNLIADMTIRGATDSELSRAVRHSMVVIDSEKHNLDFKASEKDHGIIALKRKYQGQGPDDKVVRGASTLITRATSRKDVPKRKDALVRPGVTRLSNATVDNKTGKKVYDFTGETDKHGNTKTFRSKKLAETDDAFTLVSEHGGHPIERIYAEHSNRLKALANEVRKEAIGVPKFDRSKSAAKVYSKEVEQLNAKLNDALKNAPLERRAQSLANQIVAQQRQANPHMERSDLKKIKGQALTEARARTDAKKHRVEITDREWEAIQAHAISSEKLSKILQNTDMDKLRDRATPRTRPVMTSARTSRAKAMLAQGYTYAAVAERLGIPVSTLKSSIAEEVSDG
jgi:hypothetical protein